VGLTVERVLVAPLAAGDLVALAHAMAIEADAFPPTRRPFGFARPGSRIFGARLAADGRLAGFAVAQVARHELYVERLAVDEGRRRRGVGRALVKALVSCALAEGLAAVSLHVSVVNRAAIDLYRSEGFALARRVEGFYGTGVFDDSGDAYVMRWLSAR
jgi:ribosomal-protein-alanine N-acetyltransferase